MKKNDPGNFFSLLHHKYIDPRITRWLFLVFWMYALFLVVMNLTPGSTQTLEMKKIMFVRMDYFYHAAAYMVLISLYILAAFSPRPVFRHFMIAAGFIVLILLATVPELIQNYVPRRRFNWWDMLANFTGLILGAALMLSFRFIFRQHLKSGERTCPTVSFRRVPSRLRRDGVSEQDTKRSP